MIADAPNINHLWAALLVEEFARCGIRHVVITPGSRSTPLAIAAFQHDSLECTTHFDERGAAFFALGCAKATGLPALLICTSGTAVANYLPAVVEASMAHVPLIVLTADRPPELIDVGANQAIVQPGIFGAYTRWTCELPCPTPDINPRFVVSSANHAFTQALGEPSGPVHVNCAFREPLAPTPSTNSFDTYLVPLRVWLDGDAPLTIAPRGNTQLGSDGLASVASVISKASRGLVVLGALRPGELESLKPLLGELQWPVFADLLSQGRLDANLPCAVAHYDQLLASEKFRDSLQPQCVLHIGGAVISKRLQQYLASLDVDTYIQVQRDRTRIDQDNRVTLRLIGDIATIAQQLLSTSASPTPSFAALSSAVESFLRKSLEHDALTEPGVAHIVSEHAPADSIVFVGNSMPVRDLDMFGARRASAPTVYANRGASGIDGNIATALGAAKAIGCPLTILLGDLALLHDLNSLALCAQIESLITIVVINNDGGGIFSFLPIAEHTGVFEPLFGMPHGLRFEGAARQFGLHYDHPATLDAFRDAYRAAVASPNANLIEVTTDRAANLAFHRELTRRIVDIAQQGH